MFILIRSFTKLLITIYCLILPILLLHASNNKEGTNDDYCTSNRHVVGKWIIDGPSSSSTAKEHSKSFVCCGWYSSDYNWNNTICGKTSYETNDTYKFYKGGNSDSLVTQVGASACTCDTTPPPPTTMIITQSSSSSSSRSNSRSIIRNRERYEWIPSQCTLPLWNATLFCNVLGNRQVLLFGDSTMMQVASTLMSMISYNQGQCAHQISYYRNDFLYHNHRDANSITGLAFDEVVLRLKPDICIFATGAHYRNLIDMDNVWNHIEKQIREIRKKQPNIKLFWKTQNPAHLNCMNSKLPLNNFQASKNKSIEDRFNWYLFPYFDNLSIKRSKLLDINVIDMSPLYYRIDAHAIGDCLHYCIPGPLNLFSILIFNILLTKT